MMKHNFIAGSANIAQLDDIPIVTQLENNRSLDAVMSNSFGFGGTNASLVFEKYIE